MAKLIPPIPYPPMRFYGEVYIDGKPAPDGTMVEIYLGDKLAYNNCTGRYSEKAICPTKNGKFGYYTSESPYVLCATDYLGDYFTFKIKDIYGKTYDTDLKVKFSSGDLKHIIFNIFTKCTVCTWVIELGKENFTKDHALCIYAYSKGLDTIGDEKFEKLSPKPCCKPVDCTKDKALGLYAYSKGLTEIGDEKIPCQ